MLNGLKKIDILDTTLRDGSYTIGYQFTADETAIIACGLERSGVNYIEVGHGLGLGADRAGKGSQAVEDLAYMRACAGSINRAKFGFFFLPGIGSEDDLKLLADEGGSFVRIGVSLETLDQACHFIKTAKELGLEVWANLMKTYAYTFKECEDIALTLIRSGAVGIYIVDSAGGMLPNEVGKYVSILKTTFDKTGISARIGFHGHDNLSLSTACSLSAVEAGSNIVDGSLLGIGRSVGNAATEVLAMVLSRAGYESGINPWRLADLADKTIKPFLEQRWKHSRLDQALGYARVHSGVLPILEKVSRAYNLDIRDIILALGDDACKNVTETDVVDVALNIIEESKQGANLVDDHIFQPTIIVESTDEKQPDLSEYLAEIRSQSLRMNRPSAIVVTGPWQAEFCDQIRFQQIRLVADVVAGAIEVSNPILLENLVSEIDGCVDILFLDKTPRTEKWDETIEILGSREWRSQVLPYADEISTLISLCHIIAVESNRRKSRSVAILGDNSRAQMIRQLFPYWGLRIVNPEKAAILVLAGLSDCAPFFNYHNLELVYDLMTGAINSKIAEKYLANNIEVVRLDGRGSLAGEVIGILDSKKLIETTMGRLYINGISVVAGGVWGNEGDVVVDSITKPTQIIGVADGGGGLKLQLTTANILAVSAVRKKLLERVVEGS